MSETEAAPAAPGAQPNNPWLRGPPQQLKAAAQVQQQQTQSPVNPAGAQQQPSGEAQPNGTTESAPHIPFRQQIRVARAHHHMSNDECRFNAIQLLTAQQMAIAALQTGIDLPSYQAQVAMSYGLDPRICGLTHEPGTPLTGREPVLGLTLIRDEQAYTHIELLSRYPHIATINLISVDLEPRRASYFLATCPERQVHESIKYGYFPVPAEGASAMNKAFGEMHGVGPVYFLVAANDSKAFSGMALMLGPAVPADVEKPDGVHRMPVRWVFCKNIPFGHMSHVALRPTSPEAEEQKKLHGGLQPMRLSDGNRALMAFARYPYGNSVLLDFKHYDEAEAKGVVAESGESLIRAAANQHQQGSQRSHTGGERTFHHERGDRPAFNNRGGYQGRPYRAQHHQPRGETSQANFNNPSAFPTPAQAAQATAQPSNQTRSAAPAATTNPASNFPRGDRPSRGGFSNDRGGPRGGPRASAPSRQIVAADDTRVALDAKFVFEPVIKEKQSKKRRNKQAATEGDGDELTEEQLAEQMQALQVDEDAGEQQAAEEAE